MPNRPITCPHCGLINWKYGEKLRQTYLTILNLDHATNEFTCRDIMAAQGELNDAVRTNLFRLEQAGLIEKTGRRTLAIPERRVYGHEYVYKLTRKGLTHPLVIESAKAPHPTAIRPRKSRTRLRPQPATR